MAAVLLGGLVTSALVNLLIVPAIYAALGSTEPEGERVAEPSAGPADATA
jgi:Cu/Ag efflux pump CusA